MVEEPLPAQDASSVMKLCMAIDAFSELMGELSRRSTMAYWWLLHVSLEDRVRNVVSIATINEMVIFTVITITNIIKNILILLIISIFVIITITNVITFTIIIMMTLI